jgi:hypothetical protein
MEKLNLNKKENIQLLFDNNEEPLEIPIQEAYSWSKLIEYQSLLDKIIDFIKKWYKNCKNLEGVINDYTKLWRTILDALAESYLREYANHGFYGNDKDELMQEFNKDFGSLFYSIFDDIKAVWGELSIDQISRQAYRNLRKETRGRITGIGFGLTGTISSAIGAGLGNIATGLVHSAINAVGNTIDDYSTNSKMNDYYNQKDTLEKIIDTWTVLFWRIYNNQINYFNYLIVEEDTPCILNYTEMMKLKDSARSYYENFKKASDISDSDIFDCSAKCLLMFPFEIEYWEIFIKYVILVNDIDNECIANITNFTIKMNEYFPSFYNEMKKLILQIILDGYIMLNMDKEKSNEFTIIFNNTYNYLKSNIENNEFYNYLIKTLKHRFNDKNITLKEYSILYNLLVKANIDNLIRKDTELLNTMNNRIEIFLRRYINKNIENILNAIKTGDFDYIEKKLKKFPSINTITFIKIIIEILSISFIENPDKTIDIVILNNLEKLSQILSNNIDLNKDERFQYLNYISTPIENRETLFWKFISNIISKNGQKIFGKNVQWYNIKQKDEDKIRKQLKIDNDDKILFSFDDSIFHSWDECFVFTTRGIFIKESCIEEYYSWGKLANECQLGVLCNNVTVSIKNIGYEENEKFISLIYQNWVNLGSIVLTNIIIGACLCFSGKIMKVTFNFRPIDGAIFDLEELSKIENIFKKNQSEISTEIMNNEISKEKEIPKEIEIIEKIDKSEERFHYLREDDRIYIAKKFKERKGFFKHILPSSWIMTLFFYLFISFFIYCSTTLILQSIAINESIINISIGITVFVIPIILLNIGIKKRNKYRGEKMKWKECTDSGKRDINIVFKEFQEMENEYINL